MKTIKILLSIIALSALFTSSASANSSIIEDMKQRYNPEVNYCKTDTSLLKIEKEGIIKAYSNHIQPSELRSLLNTYPFYAYRACNDDVKPLILSAFNQAKLINGKSNSVINEFKSSGARSGSSFYSSTLGETVGVVDAKDMINGVGESYKYVIKTNQAGQAKLMVNAGSINNTSTLAEESTFVFKAGRYAALAPKNSQVAKIGSTYFIYVK